jgi:primosomal protein N' (replication factor Y)
LEERLKAEIAVPIPIEKTLTYLVPDDIASAIRIGMRVVVPVKRKLLTGFVTGLSRDPIEMGRLRALKEIADDRPVFTDDLIDLARWIADYYVAPIGEVLAAMSPPSVKLRRVYRLKRSPDDLEMEVLKATCPERAGIIEALLKGKAVGLDTIKHKVRSKDISAHLAALEAEGLIGWEVIARKRRKLRLTLDEQASLALDLKDDEHELTPHQSQALKGIQSSIDGNRYGVFLLLGVTGSGKTEVYLRCIERVIKAGRRAIYLVPEIALTPQIMERIRRRFGEKSAVLHSRMSDAERYVTWLNILEGKVDVVVGARSAVFAPVRDVGIIIVDEEHEASYKQQDSPRYNAREVAIVRARQKGATVVLGSATPMIETYYNALQGKYGFYELPERIAGGELPGVSIADIRSVRSDSLISEEAETHIDRSVDRGEQVLLFLNRRGFSHFIQCRDCGVVPRCPGCYVTLTYHSHRRQLICHYCGYTEKGWDACPKCGGSNVEYVGSGTQRIEDYIARRFPDSRCARFDKDATRRKGSMEALLTDFDSGMVRLMVGTQMVAKGHDFKGVGLVVVVNADVTMNLPDFRSAERTFQILTQVAGRAGRGNMPGKVIIQTFNPDHHSLAYVARHDFKGFYSQEVGLREELHYPPFARLARVVVESRKQSAARTAAEHFAKTAIRMGRDLEDKVDVIGPSRAPVSKVRNVYRWHLILKCDRGGSLSAFLRRCLERVRAGGLANGVRFSADIDPQVMM